MPVLNPISSASLFSGILLGALLFGCDSKARQVPKPTVVQHDMLSQIDRWAVTVPNDQAVESAVITQRILYDYHFVNGSEQLTTTGMRDLGILIRHYRGVEWKLNMKPGTADADLYQKRVEIVESLLTSSGMDLSQIVIADGLPGGTGLSATDARRIRTDSIEGADTLQQESSDSTRPVFDTPLEGGF